MALTDYDKQNLNTAQQQEILNATKAWEQANSIGDKAAMAAAAAAAAQTRSGAGYTTDNSGNYVPGSGVSNAPAAASLAQSVDDGKYYGVGGSGKEFAYNPEGGIGVTNQGQTHYVNPNDEAWQKTYDAMMADTGGFSKGGTTSTVGNIGNQAAMQNQSYGANNPYADMLAAYESRLNEASSQNQRALDAALQAQISQINTQRPLVERAYQEANQKAHVQYQQAINPYGYNAEALAGLGLGKSGYAESSMVEYGNALMGAIQRNEVSLEQALRDLDNQIRQAQLSGDIEKAKAAMAVAQQIAEAGLALGQSGLEYDYRLGRDAVSDQRYNNEWQYGVGRDAISDQRYDNEWNYGVDQDAFNRAMQLAGMGDLSALGGYGADTGAISAAQSAKSSSSSSSSKPGYSQMVNAILGSDDPLVMFAQLSRDYQLTPSEYNNLETRTNEELDRRKGLTAQPAQTNPSNIVANEEDVSSPSTPPSGTESENYYAANSSLRNMYDRGKAADELSAYINGLLDKQSITIEEAMRLMQNYGLQ